MGVQAVIGLYSSRYHSTTSHDPTFVNVLLQNSNHEVTAQPYTKARELYLMEYILPFPCPSRCNQSAPTPDISMYHVVISHFFL